MRGPGFVPDCETVVLTSFGRCRSRERSSLVMTKFNSTQNDTNPTPTSAVTPLSVSHFPSLAFRVSSTRNTVYDIIKGRVITRTIRPTAVFSRPRSLIATGEASVIDSNDYPNAEAVHVITAPDFPTDDELEDTTPDAVRERLLRFIGRRDRDSH